MMIEYLQEGVFAMFSSLLLADQKGFPSIHHQKGLAEQEYHNITITLH